MALQQTMVPYLWRRCLGMVRAGVGFGCLAIYIWKPVPQGAMIAFVVAAFACYSVFILVKDNIEGSVYQISVLVLDLLFLFLCALHPSQVGLWLAAITYFYLLAFAALLYDWKHVSAIVVSTVAFFLAVRPVPAYALWPSVLLGGMLAVVLAMQKKAIENRLSSALKRSVISRSDAERARESERERIGADFHDGPLQSFISFQVRLEIIRKLMDRDPEAAMRELVQLQDLGRSQVAELRSFVRNMQPVDVNQGNLVLSLREFMEHFERDSGIVATLICGDLPEIESEEMTAEVMQIVREALNNARKHSKASRVVVTISRAQRALEISVQDDGSGFPFAGSFSLDELDLLRLGPRSIKRRIRTLGGDLVLESRPTQGSGLQIRIPR